MLKPNFNKVNNDYIFTNLKRKCKVAAVLVMIFFVSVTTVYAVPQAKLITIEDGNSQISVLTNSSTVKGAIYENGFLLAKNDEVTPSLKSSLFDGMKISIDRSKKVNLISNGFNVSYNTTAETYREFLNENDIVLSDDDIISVNLDDAIPEESQVTITRIRKEIVEVADSIPYASSQVNSSDLYLGQTSVTQQGVNGIKKTQYEVVYRDDELISTTYVGEYIASAPVDEVIAVGTKQPDALTATVGSHTFNYKTVLTCQATAYDLSFQSTGKHPGSPGYGITASGTYAKVGTVAVDPKVIPLGTKMYIVSTDGNVVYGYCTAEDTGGAIKGNKVDLFYNTTSECLQFGRRSVYVYIL